MLMDILAGVVCGLLMATVLLGSVIFMLISAPDVYDRLSKFLRLRIPPMTVMLLLVIAVPPVCALFGSIAGLLYRLADRSYPHAGLGSSNFAFTLAAVCVAAVATLVMVLMRKKAAWLGLLTNAVFAGIFGWLLPLLASWR